jgi:hypothetical protein
MSIRRRVARWVVPAVAVLLVATLAQTSVRTARADTPSQVYFDSTGQVLGSPFLDAWLDKGGLKIVGEPVSPAIQEGNAWVQWFKFGRFELNKPSVDGATKDDVQSAQLGLDVATELGFTLWHPAFKKVDGSTWTDQHYFPETGHTISNAFKGAWEKNDFGTRIGKPISQEFSLNGVTYQFFEQGALTWSKDYGVAEAPLGMIDAAMHQELRLTGQQPPDVPTYTDRVFASSADLAGERWIDINLSNYSLTAYVGNAPVLSTVIVDGAEATPTVTGEFYIYTKMDTQTMKGDNVDGTTYETKDVPWVMYFYADWAIHGAYWRDSFGYSGSHGCVNLPVDDAAWLYTWASVGTRVEVHY